MQFARINDVTLHYELISRPAEKPVIAFSNSLGTDFRIWRQVVDVLRDDFTLLLYDKRGHGLSDVGRAPYAMEDHADDLAGLLGYLSITRATICGLSVGGMIAQGLYAGRPDLVEALILCDTAHKIGTTDAWNARIEGVEKDGISSLADAILERWFTPGFRSPDNPAFAGYRNMLVRQTVAGYAGTCAALRDADYTEAAKAIAVPTLCVVGDQDGSTSPELVRELALLVPGARYEIIPGAGHIPSVEQPEALAGLIRSFLKTVKAGD